MPAQSGPSRAQHRAPRRYLVKYAFPPGCSFRQYLARLGQKREQWKDVNGIIYRMIGHIHTFRHGAFADPDRVVKKSFIGCYGQEDRRQPAEVPEYRRNRWIAW